MKEKLSQAQRLIVASFYIIAMVLLFSLLGGNLKTLMDSSNDISIWFYSGALLIVLGSYVTEPYFTKPTDTIANSISLLLALLAITNKEDLFAYYFILGFTIAMLLLSILAIALKDKEYKVNKIIYWIVKNLGSSKVIFSTIYLSSAYSYFSDSNSINVFVISIALWICIIFFDVVGILVLKVQNLLNIIQEKQAPHNLGRAIGYSNPLLYNIEILSERESEASFGGIVGIKLDNKSYSLAIIVNKKTLLDKKWVDANLLRTDTGVQIKLSSKEVGMQDTSISIFNKDLEVISINKDTLPADIKTLVEENQLYRNIEYFVGYITSGSNVNTVNFSIIKDFSFCTAKIKEGTILTANIYGEKTLYQVINGNTKEEQLDLNNSNGYICGVARKLGKYDESKGELNIVKWLPNMSEAVYILPTINVEGAELKLIAETSIGRLPETNMRIPIADINSLVTHNTAILGILGVGKSCLAYELIKKITDSNIKVVCIDITDQYYSDKGLFGYIKRNKIQNDIPEEDKDALLKSSEKKGGDGNPSAWGNIEDYRRCIKKVLTTFFESTNNVLVTNPDKHAVTKPATLFRIAELTDVTIVEKTRIISEELLYYFMEQGQSIDAKCLIVYEEAHSLIPEWNSVSNDGDKTAANGIAKVILQGRKYGLGCLVITQRTANVTKSILNQCNTVFALRVFDDTGKAFLENYIGKDYSDTLPTLEERHAIAIGKGLRLKQPVIIQLNDKSHFSVN